MRSSIKEKTSITLSKDLLIVVDRLAGSKLSRSAFIERALREYISQRERQTVNARDLKRLNAAADQLNSESAEVLEYRRWKPLARTNESRRTLSGL